ncbi:MAG: hypothetical protein QXL16_01005 [Candidatus Micrarchaeaceae archaeon]
MDAARKYLTRERFFEIREKDMWVIAEIGLTEIPSATEFVSYFSYKYNISESGCWYILKKLKKKGIIEFTEKGERYVPLKLTKDGIFLLRQNLARSSAREISIKSVGVRKGVIGIISKQ